MKLLGRSLLIAAAAASACSGADSRAEQASAAFLPPTASPLCDPPATFADQRLPRATRHVAVSGNDETGDGSPDHPYLTITRAVRGIAAGTAIHLHAGRYSGRTFLVDLHGTAEAPI